LKEELQQKHMQRKQQQELARLETVTAQQQEELQEHVQVNDC
jgi:hypothetical protein